MPQGCSLGFPADHLMFSKSGSSGIIMDSSLWTPDGFLWIPYGFLYGVPMGFHGFPKAPHGFLMLPFGNPMGYQWFPAKLTESGRPHNVLSSYVPGGTGHTEKTPARPYCRGTILAVPPSQRALHRLSRSPLVRCAPRQSPKLASCTECPALSPPIVVLIT